MKILVMNCGSSSIKYQLFNMDSNNWSVMAKGGVEKVGLKGSFLKHEKENGEKVLLEGEIMDHATGIDYILGVMTSERHGCIKSLEEIDAVGHRVVHGGETFNSSVFITDEVITKMKDCIELAPLHNPPNLKGIFAISSLLPHVLRWVSSTQRSTRPCLSMHICMRYPTHCTRNMVYVATDFTEPATAMLVKGLPKS